MAPPWLSPQVVTVKSLPKELGTTRQRDLSEIGRLKQNNDVMRQRLLTAIAERDHYLGILKARGIDPGVVPAPVMSSPVVSAPTGGGDAGGDDRAAPGPAGLAVPSPESERTPSGPGDFGSHGSGS